MAFGRKENKVASAHKPADSNTVESSVVEPKPSRQKRRKPTTTLSSVVHESAVGAAIDLMKQNTAFALPNGNAWVGLLLSVDSIGGLSQKQKGDATKGSIIELISADKIQVIATKAMLDEEFMGIVPTVETLERMEEYSLLTEAPYYWVAFRAEDGGQTLVADAVEGVQAWYSEAVQVSSGEISLRELLPDVWAWAGGQTADQTQEVPAQAELALVGATVGASSGVDADPLGEALSVMDEGDFDYAALSSEDVIGHSSELSVDGFDNEDYVAEFEKIAQAYGDGDDETPAAWEADDLIADEAVEEDSESSDDTNGYLKYLEENRDRVVDEQEVRDTIARRFLSTDLDLEVDLAEFERTFGTETPAVAIAIAEEPSDWLGSQVAQLSRQANAELERLHKANTDELRQLYVQTMALHIEKTMATVSPDAPGSQYFNLMEGAKKDFETSRSSAHREVSAQRKEILARFESAAESRAAQAATHARTVYEDKNRPKLERELAEVGLDVDRRNEENYAHDRQTVLEMRRKDANVRMDIGTNRIFESLTERQFLQREDERVLLEHWTGELTRFIDENRKVDVARSEALAEQLGRDTQIATLTAEHTVRLRELRAERADRERELTEKLARNNQEALATLEARRNEWNSTMEVEKERSRASGALVDQLNSQLMNLGSRYEEQYQGRIAALQADKDAAALEQIRNDSIQKRTNNIMFTLMIATALAAMVIGVLLGWSWGDGPAAAIGASPIEYAGTLSFESAAWTSF